MSDGTYQRYALDPTGENPDNLIIQEFKQLSDRDLRFVVPMHGPFFVKSARLYDGVTKRLLTKSEDGVSGDYVVPMISQEATLRFGEEISDSVLILNKDVASSVYVTYQALGGNFKNNISNIVNIFETFLNDNRAVDWLTGVYGKPNAYPPSLHGHFLTDIFGFETMTFMLEQIRQAILISYSPAWDILLDAIASNKATKADVDNGIVSDRLVSLEVLQHAAFRYNFNSVSVTPNGVGIKNAGTQYFHIAATNAPQLDRYYWEIEHITTTSDDFVFNNGYFSLTNGQGDFYIQTNKMLDSVERKFRISLFRGGVDRYKIFTSNEMIMNKQGRIASDTLFASMTREPTYPTLPLTSKTYSVSRRYKDAYRC